MSFRVECDTIEELRQMLLSGLGSALTGSPQRRRLADSDEPQLARDLRFPGAIPGQGNFKASIGASKSWDKAREYAREHGTTILEARSILADERRQVRENAHERRPHTGRRRGRPPGSTSRALNERAPQTADADLEELDGNEE